MHYSNLQEYKQLHESEKEYYNLNSKIEIKFNLISKRFDRLYKGVPKKRRKNELSRKEYLNRKELSECTFIPQVNKTNFEMKKSPNKQVNLKSSNYIKIQ